MAWTVAIILFVVFIVVVINAICSTMRDAFTIPKGKYNPKDDEDWIKYVNERKNPYV